MAKYDLACFESGDIVRATKLAVQVKDLLGQLGRTLVRAG